MTTIWKLVTFTGFPAGSNVQYSSGFVVYFITDVSINDVRVIYFYSPNTTFLTFGYEFKYYFVSGSCPTLKVTVALNTLFVNFVSVTLFNTNEEACVCLPRMSTNCDGGVK